MAICPGGVDTDMIKDIVNEGYNLSNKNLMKPQQVAKKIYDMIFNQKSYYNGQSIEFYNSKWVFIKWLYSVIKSKTDSGAKIRVYCWVYSYISV